MEQPPLIRSIDTDRIYRVNTGTHRLMRMLRPEFGSMNLGCFMPSNLPLWTEGSSYAVGTDVYGRYDRPSHPEIDYAYCVYKCRVAHTATEANRPTVFETTLHWQALASTSIQFYPVCGTLVHEGAEPYGGINRSPTGVLIELSGISTAPYYDASLEAAWHHDYNGVYCLPTSTPFQPWLHGGRGGLCASGVSWGLNFLPSSRWGDCETGIRTMSVTNFKRTLSDNWWHTSFLFCGSHEIEECETSYTDDNVFPTPPDPIPDWGTPECNAWLQAIMDAKSCCCPELEPWQSPSVCGGGGSVSFLGFTDYMSIGVDDSEVTYFNDGQSAVVCWRFVLLGHTGTPRKVLYDNIYCDFFRMDWDDDYNTFLGCTVEPLTPDEDGWFEKTVHVSGATISNVGFTNVNAYNWKYACSFYIDLALGTKILASVGQGT